MNADSGSPDRCVEVVAGIGEGRTCGLTGAEDVEGRGGGSCCGCGGASGRRVVSKTKGASWSSLPGVKSGVDGRGGDVTIALGDAAPRDADCSGRGGETSMGAVPEGPSADSSKSADEILTRLAGGR